MSNFINKIIVSISILLITTVQPIQAQAPEPTWQDTVSNMSVQELIEYIAPQFNQDPKLISKITFCESSHKVLPHDGGAGYGVTGIHKATFNGWNKDYEKDFNEKLNYDSTFDQIKMMSYVFEKGSSYRNQWTSYVAYSKGGTYSFYSNMMKKHYTVTCK